MQTVCSIKNKKMMLWIIIVSAFLLVLLIVRLAIIQFVDGNKLKQMAYEQQTLNRKITSREELYMTLQEKMFWRKAVQ